MSLTLSHALLLSINAVIFVNKNARVVSASQTYPPLNYQIVDISQDEGLTLDASCPIKKRKKAKKLPELCKLLFDYRNSLCQVTDQRGHQILLLFGG